MELRTIGEQTISRLRRAVDRRHGTVGAVATETPPRSELTVGTLARRNLVSVAPNATLRTTLEKLVAGDVGVVLVREASEHDIVDIGPATGLVSERDVIDALSDGADLDEVWAADVMQTDLIVVPASMTAHDAAARMIDSGIRHLVVEGPNGLGMISMRDAVAALL